MTAPPARIALPKVMGHRGVAARAPENTLAGLREAARLGLSWVEFDVMLTRDAVPVLFHDETLRRTTGCPGRMAETDYAAVKDLDAGAGFHPNFAGAPVPSLEQAVEVLLTEGLRPNVEIKPTPGRDVETVERTVAVLKALWPRDRPPPLFSSYSTMSVAAARALAPNWPRALVVDSIPARWRRTLEALGCACFHVHHRRGSEKLFREVHATGYAVSCFTVNRERRARTLFERGVDCVITDDPEGLGAAWRPGETPA
ncbi:MAG: glycerophosphodiester phosphodiesterase family protein [Kiloniellales bacterium]|nr:glycerophosphodiester phosphodiesterase family protein [Kiloniellales bacterium]